MKQPPRKELLSLVEALSEGTASAADCARLEQLVLSDRRLLRLYLEAIELHGMLYWDAAGIGSFEESLPVPLRSREPAPLPAKVERPRPVRLTAALGTAMAVLVLLAAVFTGRGWIAPDSDDLVAEHQGTPLSGQARPLPNPGDVPEVHLPPRSPASADDASSAAPLEPAPERMHAPIVLAASDEEVVRFINEQLRRSWEAHGVRPSRSADDAEWIRRVHLDLAGRIPTTAEVEAFLKESAPEKRSRLVDALLESRDYAGNFATIWTNLLVGRSRDREIERETLLGYLRSQFGENRPWKETVSDLIAARGAAHESGPANFLLAHLNNEAVPATAIAARIFLCEQMQCAQCHRHPDVAQWDQDRFWQFNAFFQQAQVRERVVIDGQSGARRRVRELLDEPDAGATYYETLKGVMQVAYPRFDGTEVSLDEAAPLRDRLAELMCSGDRPQVARAFVNRNWHHFFGRAFTRPLDDMGPHNDPSHPELLEGLTDAFVQSDFNVRRLARWICLSEAYQLSSRPAEGNAADAPEAGERPLFSRMYVKPLSAEQLYDSLMVASGIPPEDLHRRGTIHAARDRWLQQFFTAVDTEENGEDSTLDGSLTQVLMMMNGELIQRATHPERSGVLQKVVAAAKDSEVEKIRHLSLAALSRYPTNEELAAIRRMLRRHVRQRTEQNVPAQLAVTEGLRDVYWAYLNSSEFTVNR